MNKIITAIVILAAIAIGWFILNPGDTFDYVVTVDSEVTELENELASIEAAVTAGTLTQEQATDAKVRIITRLDAINSAATNSEKATLTPAQRTQLMDGLDRLKMILITYQGTLATVEASADETQVAAKVRRGGSYQPNRPLQLIVADVIEDVEVTVQDSVQDYEANAEIDAQIDEIVDEAVAEEATEEEMDLEESNEGDLSETDTDPETNDADSDDDGLSDTEEGSSSDDTTDVSAEAEINAELTN
jgi:hypothetical protein